QKAINRRVLDLAGRAEFQQLGFDEQNYITPDLRKVKRKLYSQIHRSIKDCFAVASYRDIRRCDFEEAMKYVQAWRPRLAA
ncbi:ORF6C domain-containing protein, partial [Aneurinibacillus aneurinilyticus]